ncbi:histidine kinase dimerization/phosphoacceptor domain -containing protein [Halarcobacter sp.]|uniref:sensor histidine kinase n=1 Tax=Halarcobacter sp. TaxID=2321133 RepID=UPI002AAAA0EE|nr:histidine kinase dimerization/phosphoacceptor domain -containing protein [Halarcobacter sp.]
MENKITKYKSKFLNQNKLAKRFSLTYILFSIIGVVSFNKFLQHYSEDNNLTSDDTFTFNIIFILFTFIIFILMINHMQKVIKNIDKSYKDLKRKDKARLAPYEFALNNSVDAIYWFTLDARVVYANNAACNMLGYTKEEMLDMFLEEMDPNFDRNSAQECMIEIKNTKNWTLETTQKKKDGSIINIEVSGHGFIFGGKDYICAFGRDITSRLVYRNEITNMNQELQKSVDEKEILLKEIHHRVKNNMEIISSLLAMQYRRVQDNEVKYILKQSRSRINTMALVHEFLYLGENLAYINLEDYIKRLIEDIKELYISNNTYLNFDLNIDQLIFSTNRCIQVGMVLHELSVNALKYAFKEDRDNLLCIHIKKSNDKIHLKIRDNGDGLENIDSLYKTDSIGMQLVHTIVENQLDGTIEFKNNRGLECNIFFPIKED